MANASQQMFQVCRFCLCQDDAYLIPITSLSEFAVTLQDLMLFTGIQISADQVGSYATCLECTNKLKNSATFRNTCLSNDAPFQELCVVLAASAESIREETAEYLESDANVEDTMYIDTSEDQPVEYCSGKWSPKSDQEILYEEEYIQEYLSTNSIEEHGNEDDFSYSANYIEPGESLSNDDEWGTDNSCSAFYDNIRKRRYVKRKRDIPLPSVMCSDASKSGTADYEWFENDRPTRKRKHHLCATCGLMTKSLKSHMVNHFEDFGEECPHCTKKFKHKTSLTSHIQTVHMKLIGKTCNICGKGFIHHKTYRYHMLTHQSEGKTFECKACSKTFVNAIYLRDHFNRLHNITRKNRGEINNVP